MIFNLNEQKVLSDPSGSSVFKGEKDFNDIVVNLPDNIDGHAATELNYVMHFVNSDGGYSTKILTVDSSGENLKATATVSTNITSKAQAFYAYVLMTDDEETVIGKTNGVIVMIHPVPDEENEIIPPADADKIIKGLEEIVKEATETIETATDTIEEATEAISSKQDKLTAGENITIDEDNVISAESGGVTSYNDLTDKPQINGVTLSGNKTTSDLNIETGTDDYLLLRDKPRVSSRNKNQQLYSHTIENGISFYPFNSSYDSNTGVVSLSIDNNAVIRCNTAGRTISHLHNLYSEMLNAFSYISTYTGTEINPKYQRVALIDFSPYVGNDNASWAQLAFFQDATTGEQKLAFRFSPYRSEMQRTPFVELGTKPVSAVVNQNGTITFTNSDGNTFTTTGSSVIGADGFSPVATVTQTASGATVSITDSTGTTTANIANGQDGNDYILTAQDKSDIADIVLSELPTTQGVLYGNQSN